MFEKNEEQLKKWGNSLENKDVSKLCPILTAEENSQQNDDYNVPLQLENENIFRLPVPWRKKDDHPYKASIQPIEPISFTPNPDFTQPKLPALSENNKKECACTCQCKPISNPMGQIGNQQCIGYTHPLGPTSSIIQPSPFSHLTQPNLWKEDEEETICTCPKVPLPLIKSEPKRLFVKCECNELMKNLAPTNYKCPKPQTEVKMAQILSKEDMKAASKAKEVGKSRTPKKPTKSSERVKTKGEVCCCCAESKDKKESEKKKEKSKADDQTGKVETRGGDDKVMKKHKKPETITVKKKSDSKDKNIKGGQKKKSKDISKEKKKIESKKKEKDTNIKTDSLKKSGSVSKKVTLDTKIESTKSKSKNVNKLVVDKKPSSSKQESRDIALVDEKETSKNIKSKTAESEKSKPKMSKSEKSERKKYKSEKKSKISKQNKSEKKEYTEKPSIKRDSIKKIDELVNKQETNLIESDFTKGMYPGTTVGHATCCLPFIRVPSRMGWLWNLCEGAGQIKPDLGWRPGAIRASTFATMKANRNLNTQNKQFEEEESIDEEMEEEDEAGYDNEEDEEDDSDLVEDEDDESEEEGDVKNKRKRAKPLIKEDEQEDVTKPTLHLHKTKGQYYISMYTPEDKEKKKEDEGRVLVSFNRKTLELGSSVTGSMSGQSSTITEDSMEFDYTTPYALYKQAKRPEKSNAQTQWKKI